MQPSTHKLSSLVFVFISMHHSKYHKQQGREANNISKECASLLTLRRRLCGSFSYSNLRKLIKQLKKIRITPRFLEQIGHLPSPLTSFAQPKKDLTGVFGPLKLCMLYITASYFPKCTLKFLDWFPTFSFPLRENQASDPSVVEFS